MYVSIKKSRREVQRRIPFLRYTGLHKKIRKVQSRITNVDEFTTFNLYRRFTDTDYKLVEAYVAVSPPIIPTAVETCVTVTNTSVGGLVSAVTGNTGLSATMSHGSEALILHRFRGRALVGDSIRE